MNVFPVLHVDEAVMDILYNALLMMAPYTLHCSYLLTPFFFRQQTETAVCLGGIKQRYAEDWNLLGVVEVREGGGDRYVFPEGCDPGVCFRVPGRFQGQEFEIPGSSEILDILEGNESYNWRRRYQ